MKDYRRAEGRFDVMWLVMLLLFMIVFGDFWVVNGLGRRGACQSKCFLQILLFCKPFRIIPGLQKHAFMFCEFFENNNSPSLLIAFVHQCGKRLNWAIGTNNSSDTWSQVLSCRLAVIGLKVKGFCGWQMLKDGSYEILWPAPMISETRPNGLDRSASWYFILIQRS